jgi:hypothetical protein
MIKNWLKKSIDKFLPRPEKDCFKAAASFGAKGDGVIDDTRPLQEWLT